MQVLDPSGKFVRKFGRQGAGPSEFETPKGIGMDSAGNLLVVDHFNFRIQAFKYDGSFITMFGCLHEKIEEGSNGWSASVAARQQLQFEGTPYSIAVDKQ